MFNSSRSVPLSGKMLLSIRGKSSQSSSLAGHCGLSLASCSFCTQIAWKRCPHALCLTSGCRVCLHDVHTYLLDNFTTNCGKSSKPICVHVVQAKHNQTHPSLTNSGKSSKLKLCRLVEVVSEVVIDFDMAIVEL